MDYRPGAHYPPRLHLPSTISADVASCFRLELAAQIPCVRNVPWYQESVRELGGAAFRAPRGEMLGGATQAISALLVDDDVRRHRLLLAP